MMPAVFGREPIPMVFRRHADRDPVGRIAAQILERALKTELEHDYFEDTMKSVTQDVLLCGRGVTWVRFEPHFAEGAGGADPGDGRRRGRADDRGAAGRRPYRHGIHSLAQFPAQPEIFVG